MNILMKKATYFPKYFLHAFISPILIKSKKFVKGQVLSQILLSVKRYIKANYQQSNEIIVQIVISVFWCILEIVHSVASFH